MKLNLFDGLCLAGGAIGVIVGGVGAGLHSSPATGVGFGMAGLALISKIGAVWHQSRNNSEFDEQLSKAIDAVFAKVRVSDSTQDETPCLSSPRAADPQAPTNEESDTLSAAEREQRWIQNYLHSHEL